MSDKFVVLSVRASTKEILLNDCIAEFLSHHPEYDDKYITQDLILRKVCRYYLDE